MSRRNESDSQPWAEAIAVADSSGDLSGIADLFLDPRVTEIDRVGLADLFSRKVLRPLRPEHVRNGMIRADYRRLRSDGMSASAAIAVVAEKHRVDERAVRPILRRSQRKIRWSAPSEPAA